MNSVRGTESDGYGPVSTCLRGPFRANSAGISRDSYCGSSEGLCADVTEVALTVQMPVANFGCTVPRAIYYAMSACAKAGGTWEVPQGAEACALAFLVTRMH